MKRLPMKELRFQLSSAAIVIAIASLTGCSPKTAPAAAPEVVRGVHLVQVTTRKTPDLVDAVGTVHAVESATLSAQITGTVANIAVREGDRVRAGQKLITIAAAQMKAQVERADASIAAMEQQVAAAESDLALAASTLRRYEMLKAEKSVSPQEFDEVNTRSKAAAARLAALRAQQAEATAAASAARTMQGYTLIRAPFDGVVTERKVDPGAMATPGNPLLTVERSGRLQLETSVDESVVSSVRTGSAVPVIVDALGGRRLEARVARIVPAADPGSRSFLVKIDLPSTPGLYSGMFGHALLPRGNPKDMLMVPRTAIVTHGSMQSVYVVGAGHIAGVRYISAGAVDGNEIEVLSGLSAGESVVESPGDAELGGKRIEAQP